MNQKERLLEYLKTHVGIVPLEALRELGIYRLAARVADLRRDGYKIETIRREVITSHGEKSNVAEYRLVKEND